MLPCFALCCPSGVIGVRYVGRQIIVSSESASAVAIAKETITRLATFRRTMLEESINANEDAVVSFLNLVTFSSAVLYGHAVMYLICYVYQIRQRLEYQLSLARKMDLLDAIQEITLQVRCCESGTVENAA
jgi:hypothetical protein